MQSLEPVLNPDSVLNLDPVLSPDPVLNLNIAPSTEEQCLPRPCAWLVMVLMPLLLSGCITLGPDFEEPEVTWLADWQSDLYGQASAGSGESDLRFWWQLFDDPVLNELIETARRENPSLRIAGLRILESRAALGIAGSNLYPQLQQLGGAATRVHDQRSNGRDRSLTSYSADFSLGWELDFWGRFQRGIESADAAFFASIASQRDAQVLLSAQVANLYFAYRTTLLRIEIARHNAAIQQRSFDITRKIFESGQGSELDLQQAKTQYLATLSTIPDLEATLVQQRNALGVLLARPPGQMPELPTQAAPLPEVEAIMVREVPARLLLRRPDIRMAAWQVAIQSAQIGIAQADYYPAITLRGSIGWSANSLDGSADTLRTLGGPSLSWNLFDHGRITNNVRLQDARLQQTIESFQNEVLQAAREIDDAAIAVVKGGEQLQILSDSRRAAERSLELATTRYREGYADFQRVLDAQRVLFSQAERELVSEGARLGAIITLYKALGGGWLDTPIEQLVPESVRNTMRSRTHWGHLLDAPLPTPADSSLKDSTFEDGTSEASTSEDRTSENSTLSGSRTSL
ncbi:efflux transporter outer membrane subunit [Halomonas binhaiensis]|uniref:Efflux transporter outer membrane subunit n=1 Tax=Halomonas binhaiensis TaxID=2562282 RepID=A0A856QWB3_9GAMM|nr:efflux transporter outer membrane subunit [Halomonas binhaiensis]QEM84124.2 efflux transporter outer membrane subunit [Halomonas binhaiensis]